LSYTENTELTQAIWQNSQSERITHQKWKNRSIPHGGWFCNERA